MCNDNEEELYITQNSSLNIRLFSVICRKLLECGSVTSLQRRNRRSLQPLPARLSGKGTNKVKEVFQEYIRTSLI